MRGWPTSNNLRDVLVPRNEIVHPRDRPTGEAVFVGLEHIEPGTGRRVGSLPIRLEELTGRKARFHPGDIVYGYLRPYLNKVWIADFEGYCSVDQYVFEVSGAVPEYVGAFMRSPVFLSTAPIMQTPGQLPRIRLDEILGVPLRVPTVDQQHRIAANLHAQQSMIKEISERVEEMSAQTSDLNSVIRDALFDGLIAPRERLGELITEPGAIIDGPFGSNLKGDHYKPSGVRVIRLGNIGLGAFIDIDRAYVTPAHAARLHRHRADVGDVVVAALGDGARPAGRACLVPPELKESIVKADCFRVRTAGSELDGAFLMHVMNSPQTLDYIRGSTRGATRPRMNLQMLKELEIPVPPMGAQRRIVAELDARLAEVSGVHSAIRAEQEAIDALPAALLRRAFEDPAA